MEEERNEEGQDNLNEQDVLRTPPPTTHSQTPHFALPCIAFRPRPQPRNPLTESQHSRRLEPHNVGLIGEGDAFPEGELTGEK